MTKLLPSLALVLVASTGLALPAIAEDSFGSFDPSYQVLRLRDAGVNAVAGSENTSDTMRVTIAQGDGNQTWVLYDIDSLKPVGGSYDNEATGSIGKATVHYDRAPAGVPESLNYEGDGSF